MKWRQFLPALCLGSVALSVPAVAQESAPRAEEPELAPIVKRLSGEDLPVALRLATFVSKTDKAVEFDIELAKRSLEGIGLAVSDADLELLDSLYGTFDADQRTRHEEMLREFAGQPEKISEAGEEFLLERASFTGGVLGAWLAHLRDRGQETDAFLLKVVQDFHVTAFWGGRPPTMEGLERQAAAFEESFRQEYGIPLAVVLQPGQAGGDR